MTLPDERYRAVVYTEKFLQDLINPEVTKRVPKEVRDRARALLRHYPSEYYMSMAAESRPDVFATRMEDLHRFLVSGEESSNK